MSSKDMEALLMMKKRKEEEEDLRKQLELSTFSETDLFSSFSHNDAIKLGLGMDPHSHMSMMMEQQMQMTMQLQRKMMMQAKMLSEEQKKIEERRKFDDLHLSINNLQKMILMKEGMGLNNNNDQKGSVKMRVGPKNPLPRKESSSTVIKREYSLEESKCQTSSKIDRRPKRFKFENNKLPNDLVLTNLTDEGPKPAPKRIFWKDKDGTEDNVVLDIGSDDEY